jgi:hypothetical protein
MNIKKYLPFILLGVGVLVLIVVFVVLRNKKAVAPTENGEDAAMMEVPLEKRPIIALAPDEVGHYLKLKIEKINIEGAKTMDYELIYEVPDGPSQGVPGSVDIAGQSSFNADLLLGSESSGKFRYDEGVSSGTVTLRFRNEAGKLIAKFGSDFHMQENGKSITSSDGKFTYTFASEPKGAFFVVMNSVGVRTTPPSKDFFGPYSVYTSGNPSALSASEVTIEGSKKVYVDGSQGWEEAKGTMPLGTYIGTK